MSEADSDRRVVDGRFELQARLGGGGMGMVWRATDLVLHRSVAVKEVRPPTRDWPSTTPRRHGCCGSGCCARRGRSPGSTIPTS